MSKKKQPSAGKPGAGTKFGAQPFSRGAPLSRRPPRQPGR